MSPSTSQRWLGPALLCAVFYAASGVILGAMAHGSATQVRGWRLAAWLVSGVAFVAHIGYERYRLRHRPSVAALHAALAAALGAFGLAAAATVRAAMTETGNLRLLAIALVAWPLLTAVPAFLVALGIATLLGRGRQAT